MNTDYLMLLNSEQQSDILEADKMLSIMNANHTAAQKDCRVTICLTNSTQIDLCAINNCTPIQK